MDCIEITSTLGCWSKADGSTENVGIINEYRKGATGELVLYKTRYALPDGTLVALAAGESVSAGQCIAPVVPMSAPGSLLAANACVGTPILVPSGNFDDLRTVGAAGTYATLAAAMADATVVDGTILRFVDNVVDTTTVTLNRAVVVDLNGFTHSNATSVNQISITVPLVVIKDGTIHHTKVTNTSLETAISTNVTAPGPVFIVNNTIKVQEFGILVRGAAMIEGNHFEYAGASATNSHRFISLLTINGETRIHNNTFLASNRSGTTRYSNFVFIATTTGAVWNAPLFVTNNTQTGGDLRQFVFNETLLPTAGSKLIVTGNTFNDFNGGVGLFGAALYNGLDEILIADNVQGADAVGNFKGVFFVDGSSGTLDDDTLLQYGGNTTTAGPLRADYLSLASDTDNILAHRNLITPPTEPVEQVKVDVALQDTGLLLQELKARRTYVEDANGNPLQGFGTEADPYRLPDSTALWTDVSGTLKNVDESTPVEIKSTDVKLHGTDEVVLESGGTYKFIGVPQDLDNSATKALVYNQLTGEVEHKDLLAIAGDRYKTVSPTCNDIVSSGTVTFMVEPNLAYTPQQDLIAIGSTGNTMSGEVVSYNDITGELVLDVQASEGSGNFCDWIINIDAIKLAPVSVYYGTNSPVVAGQPGVEGDQWYVTTNTAAPSEENITEHWVYDWTLGWKRVWKKEYMFEIQLTDSFDATYYYYAGDVGPDWQVHRYLHTNPADPLYMIPEIAEQSNNSGITTLAAAFAARTTLTYA